MDRRTFLTTATVLGGSLLAGCTNSSVPRADDSTREPQSAAADDSGSTAADGSGSTAADGSDEWFAQMNNYDGVVDRTGDESVTVTVGVETDTGTYFAFDPAAIRVSPGTTVTWEWLGNGGSHNVHAVDGADFESQTTAAEGHTFEQRFESERRVEYQCDPHTGIGMKGAVLVGGGTE